MSKLPANVWVVIPAYNEEKYIAQVIKNVLNVTPNVVVVDDGSSDQTSKIAQKHLKNVITHQVNLGKGAALKTGCIFAFEEMKAQAVITMDSDGQHDPTELRLFAKELQSHELVFGVRSFTGMPAIRASGNKFISWFIYILFGVYVPDILSGYKAFTKKMYQKIEWESNAYGVEVEIAARVARFRLPLKSVPIATIYHDFDRGMTLLDALSIISHIVSWRLVL